MMHEQSTNHISRKIGSRCYVVIPSEGRVSPMLTLLVIKDINMCNVDLIML